MSCAGGGWGGGRCAEETVGTAEARRLSVERQAGDVQRQGTRAQPSHLAHTHTIGRGNKANGMRPEPRQVTTLVK